MALSVRIFLVWVLHLLPCPSPSTCFGSSHYHYQHCWICCFYGCLGYGLCYCLCVCHFCLVLISMSGWKTLYVYFLCLVLTLYNVACLSEDGITGCLGYFFIVCFYDVAYLHMMIQYIHDVPIWAHPSRIFIRS